MKATLSTKGQIILPSKIRNRGRFAPGDKFDIREKNGTIILKPVKQKRNRGLLKLLRSCPAELVLPERDSTDTGRPAIDHFA